MKWALYSAKASLFTFQLCEIWLIMKLESIYTHMFFYFYGSLQPNNVGLLFCHIISNLKIYFGGDKGIYPLWEYQKDAHIKSLLVWSPIEIHSPHIFLYLEEFFIREIKSFFLLILCW